MRQAEANNDVVIYREVRDCSFQSRESLLGLFGVCVCVYVFKEALESKRARERETWIPDLCRRNGKKTGIFYNNSRATTTTKRLRLLRYPPRLSGYVCDCVFLGHVVPPDCGYVWYYF